MKRLLVSILVLLLVALSLAAYGWSRYQKFRELPLIVAPEGVVLMVDPGMSGRAVVARLKTMGVTPHNWEWRVLMRLQPIVMRAGEYRLTEGMTPLQLLTKIERGDVIRYRFTIVEGWTFKQLLDALRADPVLRPDDVDLAEAARREQIELEWDHPEGAFLPETYSFTRGDTRMDILRRAHQALRKALADAWQLRADDHPVKTPYDLLILASIVEKETGLSEERQQVSGVFVRRLKKGMRLQTDPTVIYGLGETYDGDIRREDLNTDTPYNTYTRFGLPPTPIAMPGRAALLAAAQPAAGDALYFVADGQGGHTFSATLEEHQRAVNKMLGRQ